MEAGPEAPVPSVLLCRAPWRISAALVASLGLSCAPAPAASPSGAKPKSTLAPPPLADAKVDVGPYIATDGPYAKAVALGIRIGNYPPGRHDAITDVAGVRVGHVTHIRGAGRLQPGVGPVRTGVTAVVPRADVWRHKVFAAQWALNGNGELTGGHWVNESGWLDVPILMTDTLSVGRVADGVVSWMIRQYPRMGIDDDVVIPVVGECDDGFLNDQQGRHNTAEDALTALEAASAAPPAQGAVGAGTGMVAFDFKGGIGTSSRVLPADAGGYTVGVLVNANLGGRSELVVDGVPIGRRITDLMPGAGRPTEGSIIVVIATDAPLLHDGLHAVARRAALGLARIGARSSAGSGDIVIALSTGNDIPHYPNERTHAVTALSRYHIDPVFEAAQDAVEEAVLNSMLAAPTTEGRDGNTAHALPHDRLLELLREAGRRAP